MILGLSSAPEDIVITSSSIEKSYVLAPMQHGMLFHSVISVGEGVYIGHVICKLSPETDLSAFERAWKIVIERHEALRTSFAWQGLSEPVQRVHRDVAVPIEVWDWTNVPVSEHEGRLQAYLAGERNRGFDLSAPPLMRFALLKIAAGGYLFLWTSHHILLDGRSRLIVMKEVARFYETLRNGGKLELSRPPLYSDYIDWFYRQDHSAAEEYWKRLLHTFKSPVSVELPREESHFQSGERYGAAQVNLASEVKLSLRALAHQNKISVNLIAQAAWAVLLARYGSQEDVVFGETRACRTLGFECAASVVGILMNTVPVRLYAAHGREFVDLLLELRAQHLERKAYEHTPLVRIRECSGIDGTAQLFQSIVVFEEFDLDSALRREGCGLWQEGAWRFSPAHYPLILAGYHKPELSLEIIYDRHVYPEAAMARLTGHLTTILEEVVVTPHARIADLPLLTAAERQLLKRWNLTDLDCGAEACVHQLFEEQADKTPDALAVVCGDDGLSYSELSQRANRLAHYLRKLGVRPDTRVAICMERSLEMMVGLLGVLKAGGAYVPLDPAYPAERLQFMLEDSASVVMLTQSHLIARFQAIEKYLPVLDLTAAAAWNDQPAADPEFDSAGLSSKHLAYVIYTSGSTGMPKGVAVEHHNLINLIRWHWNAFDLKAGMRSSSVAGFGFDAATWEIWPVLCVGSTLLLPSPMETRNPEALLTWWQDQRLDVSFLPTPIGELAFTLKVTNSHLHTLLVGGDRLHRLPPSSAPFLLVNNYGPTETTVVATSGRVDSAAAVLSIGRPISNTRVYILNEHQQQVPIGVEGELYVGGAGVGRGYLNRPDLTAERFLGDPFAERAGARMYRTGDLGRWLDDGTIEFLRRSDFQVKIRGFRIELQEIEARLAEYPGVLQTVVLARESTRGEKCLVAYYTADISGINGDAPEAAGLRAHLVRTLPEYMVPAAYVHLESFPLTPNGKLDRRALPVPESSAYGARGYEAPVGEIETIVAGIWADVLKLEQVGRCDHFFEVGGHSLLAMRLISHLRQALGLEAEIGDLFAYPVLADFARKIANATRIELPLIPHAERSGRLPLSFAQQRLWFLAQLEGANSTYHIHWHLHLKGQLVPEALRRALDRIVARHEALRTTFIVADGEATQSIATPEKSYFHLTERDFRGCEDGKGKLDRLIAEEASRNFDMEEGPLIRGWLLRQAEEEYTLLIAMHHIISDGWSMGVLAQELSALYRAFVRGEEDPLPKLDVQYADYAVWQRKWMEEEALRRQGEYWEKTLRGTPALLELPADHARPVKQDYTGARAEVVLDLELTRALKDLSRRHAATLYMTLLGAWATLLARLSGQTDIVIGTPTANRGRMEIEGLIGFFVNTLAIRFDMSAPLTVGGLLGQVKRQTLAAQQHQDMPFEQVVEIVRPARSLAHSPLFQVMFAWQNTPEFTLDLPEMQTYSIPTPHVSAKYDLTLYLRETSQGIAGGLEYATSLFEKSTIKRYLGHFRTLLQAMVADDIEAVDHLPLLRKEERDQILYQWNQTEENFYRQACTHELFQAQAHRSTDATALVCDGSSLTYGELNRRANKLAHYLRELGVKPDQRVAICLERGIDMVVSVLAVFKAGAAYVPLDPAYPAERLRYMLEDCVPAVLLTQGNLEGLFAGIKDDIPVIDIAESSGLWEDRPDSNADIGTMGLTSRNMAYVIYTSGSAGKPKGVMVEHRGLLNMALAQTRAFDVGPASRVIQFASFSFDASVFEILMALLRGASLYIPRRGEVLAGETLVRVLAQFGITHATLPPAVLATVSKDSDLESLRELVVAGEALPDSLASRWSQGRQLTNAYGPTETTIWATRHVCEVGAQGNPSIGRPITNTRTYILGPDGEPVPMGVAGELYIGGVGVARGYLNRPGLSAERFLPDPFSKEAGVRLYRTGDLARWAADGTIEFLGRNDFQVKIRGFRIELAEIEANMEEYPALKQAVVIARDDESRGKQLVAYYISEEPAEGCPESIGAQRLVKYLSARLPEYMVPTTYVRLEKLPLTPNGKLDRQALPAPERTRNTERRAPRTDLETILCSLFAVILGMESIGIDDNFFELGGHSLLATRLVNHIRTALGIELSIREIFEAPTVSGIVVRLNARESERPALRPALIHA